MACFEVIGDTIVGSEIKDRASVAASPTSPLSMPDKFLLLFAGLLKPTRAGHSPVLTLHLICCFHCFS
jgi:hypothetical protein